MNENKSQYSEYEMHKRIPNEKDAKTFVYMCLRELYFNKKCISLIQYRTVKGQIFKDYELGYNFMKKYYPSLDRIIERIMYFGQIVYFVPKEDSIIIPENSIIIEQW